MTISACGEVPVSQAYQGIADIAFSGSEVGATRSQTRRDTNFAIPGYSLFCHDTTANGKNKSFFCLWSFLWSKPLLCRFRQPGKIQQTQVSQGFAAFRLTLSRIPPRHSQSKRATNCANPGYEIQTDPTAGCSNSGVCLQMATPQNLTAVHVACRKRTECRRKTILYFTEICRKVKSYMKKPRALMGTGH